MNDVVDVINRINLFHVCVDNRDWTTAQSCLAETVRMSQGGGEAREIAGAAFLGMIRANVEKFAATQHLVSGHHVAIGPDGTALCRASYQSHHVHANGRWVLAGQQDIRLHRLDGEWRITAVTLRPAWEDGAKPDAFDVHH